MVLQRILNFALFFLSTAAGAQTVAIDVGHGLTEVGAISARGRPEFEFNRDLAGKLASAVAAHGLSVREVNFDGHIGGLFERPLVAAGSDFFVSIHHDSVSEPWLREWEFEGRTLTYTDAKRGFGLFVSAANPDLETSLRCASAMGAMLRLAGFTPSDWHARRHQAADAENGVWYYDNLVVLYRTSLPAVLVEAGVIKHRDEELELLDPEHQARMTDALATGIAACMQVSGLPAANAGE